VISLVLGLQMWNKQAQNLDLAYVCVRGFSLVILPAMDVELINSSDKSRSLPAIPQPQFRKDIAHMYSDCVFRNA
jgi:hypothetical protein